MLKEIATDYRVAYYGSPFVSDVTYRQCQSLNESNSDSVVI